MRQLIKFCLVGASSTIIDKGIFWILLRTCPFLPWFVSQTIAFVFGVTNGFFWNRQWTFRSNDHSATKKQYPKFVATNLVGLALNLLLTKGFLVLFTGQAKHNAAANAREILIASLCAVPIVVIWNFSASRLWTFKTPRSAPPENPAPLAPPR